MSEGETQQRRSRTSPRKQIEHKPLINTASNPKPFSTRRKNENTSSSQSPPRTQPKNTDVKIKSVPKPKNTGVKTKSVPEVINLTEENEFIVQWTDLKSTNESINDLKLLTQKANKIIIPDRLKLIEDQSFILEGQLNADPRIGVLFHKDNETPKSVISYRIEGGNWISYFIANEKQNNLIFSQKLTERFLQKHQNIADYIIPLERISSVREIKYKDNTTLDYDESFVLNRSVVPIDYIDSEECQEYFRKNQGDNQTQAEINLKGWLSCTQIRNYCAKLNEIAKLQGDTVFPLGTLSKEITVTHLYDRYLKDNKFQKWYFPLFYHDNHWILVVFNWKTEKIIVYDSLSTKYVDDDVNETISCFITRTLKDPNYQDYLPEIRFKTVESYSRHPQQPNYNDCGVFCLMTISYLLQKTKYSNFFDGKWPLIMSQIPKISSLPTTYQIDKDVYQIMVKNWRNRIAYVLIKDLNYDPDNSDVFNFFIQKKLPKSYTYVNTSEKQEINNYSMFPQKISLLECLFQPTNNSQNVPVKPIILDPSSPSLEVQNVLLSTEIIN